MVGSLGTALKNAGLDPLMHHAQTIASNFIASGGTREQWIAAFNAAEEMSGMRPASGAGKSGHTVSALPRHPVEDAESQARFVSTTTDHPPNAPTSSFNRGGEDHSLGAPKKGQDVSVLPAREPTVSQRNAMREVAKVIAVTIMDTLKIDGIAIGDWSIALARVEGRRKTRDGYILREAVKVVANAPDFAKLRDVLKISEIQRIKQSAEEAASAV